MSTAISLFFNDSPSTEIYTLSLHDALPICVLFAQAHGASLAIIGAMASAYLISNFVFQYPSGWLADRWRSEEHTSELQSHSDLVCRLLLEKKKIRCSHSRCVAYPF